MKGYYLYPNVLGDRVLFTSDDDIYEVSLSGGEAIRLTSDMGIAVKPKFSPDGKQIAFLRRQLGEEAVSEVYVMPSDGGEARRLTYFGSPFTDLVGWLGDKVIVSSDYHRPFSRWPELFEVSPTGGQPIRLPYGNATTLATDGKAVIVGRNTADLTYWKRYRGGTWGRFWIDREGNGKFQKFLDELEGNLTSPLFANGRFYFISDHEGIGNVYSVNIDGGDLRRHTDFRDFYARNASSDGKTIVVQSGGDIYVVGDTATPVPIEIPSARKGRAPKFVEVFKNLEDFQLHPNGKTTALCVRGKNFVLGNFEGPVIQAGASEGARYRLPRFAASGDSMFMVSDSGGEYRVELVNLKEGTSRSLAELGDVEAMEPSPKGDLVAVTNNRFELWVVSTSDGSARLIDKSDYGAIGEVSWHKEGDWLAYGFPEGYSIQTIKLANVRDGTKVTITTPSSYDFSPSFDPDGNYLYYLSARSMNPNLDRVIFEMGFPRPIKPYLVILSKKPSPFLKDVHLEAEEGRKEGEGANPGEKTDQTRASAQTAQQAQTKIEIDLDGIGDRIEAFPVEDGNYVKLVGLKKGKVALLSFPQDSGQPGRPSGAIDIFDLETASKDRLLSGVSWFNTNGSLLLVRAGDQLRVVDPEKKVDQNASEPGPKTGVLDVGRVKVFVKPEKEWEQMLRETWRLMRDYYWREDMNGVDWNAVYEKYRALLPRLSTRFELSDVIREMQGELGTSHAYEIGGEYDMDRAYTVGGLGAEFKFNGEGYEVVKLIEGDRATDGEKSPLKSAGISPGDVILAIDGVKLDETTYPSTLLLNRGGSQVLLTVKAKDGGISKKVVKVLRDERNLVYRDWVESNRNWVHQRSGGRVGYVHVPDMGARGFAEFHRLYKAEAYRDGLIIDLRYNSGGFISSLIIEKIARKRIAQERPRRGKPAPYPVDAPPEAMAALINEATGSDGDIFSHAFKMLKLGPLIGTRTWGGVIGINFHRRLLDGTTVTQPQFAFFFSDIGLGLENHGEEPDLRVDVAPQDYAAGYDPQLELAVQEVLKRLEPGAGSGSGQARRV
ncbi:MAG: S41 family peptidase [Candidatus Marsarchaeota archaeon]